MHSAPLSLPHHSSHTKESQLIPAPLLCWGGRHCKAVHPLFRVGWTLDFHQDLLRVTRIVSVFQSLFHLQVWMVIQDLYLLAVDGSTCVRMLVWTLLNCQVPWWRAQPRSAWAAKAWASEEAHVFSIGPAGFVAHLGGEGLWTEAGHPDWNCLGIWGMCDGRGGSNDWLRCKELGHVVLVSLSVSAGAIKNWPAPTNALFVAPSRRVGSPRDRVYSSHPPIGSSGHVATLSPC